VVISLERGAGCLPNGPANATATNTGEDSQTDDSRERKG